MRRQWRPEFSSRPASLLVGLWMLVLCNNSFWPLAYRDFGGWNGVFISFVLSISFLLLCGLLTLSVKYLFKPLAILLLLTAAAASYFTDTFGTIINESMIDNAMTTNAREAGALISTRFLIHFALYGLLPVALLLFVRLRHEDMPRKVAGNLKLLVPMLAATGAMVYLHLGAFIITIRQDNLLMQTLNPVAPIAGAWNWVHTRLTESTLVAAPLGLDARKGPVISGAKKPVITVLVTGETGRAMNFSLNGYGRKTNPELEKLDIINYPDVTSCGTDTAASVPCMFSNLTRANYSESAVKASENLLDVVRHAGMDAIWWDNNTGSKGVADRSTYVPFMDTRDPLLCPNDECRDSVFLERLAEKLAGTTKDTLLVLHQIGSHGPAYYRRYPDDLRAFTPDCRTPDLPKCSLEEVRNAYDNSIVATDRFLADVIGILKKNDDHLSSALLYASDHGESLGENGLFLHGAPYAFAPKEQTHVPMITWYSPSYGALMGIDHACLAKQAGNAYSHDNWFHTALGMLDIQTSVYNGALDLYRTCRAKG
nr:phosphoethanolamine--lipid A transferase [uncultured Gellertiella sp.]